MTAGPSSLDDAQALRTQLGMLALANSERATWLFDLQTLRFVWANAAALSFWRARDLDELVARDPTPSPATIARIAAYEAYFQVGRSIVDRWTFYPGGVPVTLLCTARGVRLPDGHNGMVVEGCSAELEDLTRHDLRAVEALRHTSAIVTLFSEQGELLMQNPAAQQVFGLPRGSAASFVGRFRDAEFGRAALARLLSHGSFRGEVELVTEQGLRWHAMEGRRTADPATGDVALVVDQRDISDRRLADDAMHAGELRFRALCMQTPVGLLHTDAIGRCIFVNARWCAITGVAEHDGLGSGWLRRVHPDDRERVLSAWQLAWEARQETTLRFRYRHDDGHDVWVVFNAVPVLSADGKLSGYVSAVSDITKGVLSEQRFALVFEQARDAHLFVDEAGLIIDCNQGAVQLHAVESKANLIGRSVLALSPAQQPGGLSSQDMDVEVRARAVELGSHRFTWVYRRINGTEFTAEVSLSSLSLDGQRVFFSSSHDTTERTRAEEAILRSREQALEASRAKSQFLANMSHEIRTPMNGVLGMLLLALGTELSPEQREYLVAAQGSAEGLLAILNDILDLSKIEAGKLNVDRVGFSVEEMLRRCLQVTAQRAHAKDLELVVQVAEDVPRGIVSDPLRVGQVLTNLLGNAVKFTERGQVVVSIAVVEEQGSSALALRVEDSGIGISAERQALIFDAFQQADNSTTRRFGGTGLGLTICRELVTLLGGQLRLESELGKGATFTATIPLVAARTVGSEPPHLDLGGRSVLVVEDHALARASLASLLTRSGARVLCASDATEAFALALDAGPVQAAFVDHGLGVQDGLELPALLRRYAACRDTRFILLRSRERVGREALHKAGFDFALDKPTLPGDLSLALTAPLLQTANTSRHASLPTRTRSEPRHRALHVLVVEDHPVNAHFISSLLRREGHRVVHASTGVGALAALERQTFDVILMDMQMPEMDGLEATRRIRKGESHGARRVPIVALTANAMKGDEEACLAAGMDSYLAKPIDPERLESVLATIAAARPSVLSEREPRAATALAAVRGTPPEEPAYARDALLQRACGDPRFTADLIRIFVGTQDEMIRDVEGAVAKQDLAAVRDAAHRLKGALQLVCAEPSARLAAQLEQAGKARHAAPIPGLLHSLRHELERLRAAFGDLG